MDKDLIPRLHREYIKKGFAVCTDSRKANKNSIFFALKGENFDGNRFAAKALDTGCAVAVIDNPKYKTDHRCLLVDNVLETLQQLSLYHRNQFHIPVIGITGTNGKTTTKELLFSILSRAFQTFATEGNLNNHIGVPLSLLSFKEPLDIAIIEMGANHQGEIANLCQLSRPGFGIITNIGKAHLEGFGSVENIAKAKSELFRYIKRNGGKLFIPGDNPLLCKLGKEIPSVFYGNNPENHCRGKITNSFPFVSLTFETPRGFGQATRGIKEEVKTRLTGNYNFENIMAAITMGLYFGVPATEIKKALENYEPKNSRSQILETGNNLVIMDAYNANPTSMVAAIENFSNFKKEGKMAVILGDMLEMGKEAEKEHQFIFRKVMEQNYDLNIFVGSHFSEIIPENSPAQVFENAEEAAQWLKKHLIKNYTVLVKGSRGIELEKITKHL